MLRILTGDVATRELYMAESVVGLYITDPTRKDM